MAQINKKCLAFVVFSSFLLLGSNPIPANFQKKPQEKVIVIAVEVPVRVLLKGRFLKELTKEDFEIYQNGVKQEIIGFEIHSRNIAVSKDIHEEELKINSEKRLFILIFNIFDYQENVGQAIDYFFENFFSSGDQLIILTEDRIFDIERGRNVSGVARSLKETLKKYKLISTFNTYKAYRDLRFEADRLLEALRGGSSNASLSAISFY
jgi:hypothetical protein